MNNPTKLHFRRFELKYPLSHEQYYLLKTRISDKLTLDPFAKKTGSYLIESVYFDTPSFYSFRQKKAGIKKRTKYRLRRYLSPKSKNDIFWEIKQKTDMIVIKDRSLVSLSKTKKILKLNQVFLRGDKILQKFTLSMKRHLLKPAVLVRYRREPYFNSFPDLRVTFDSQIETGPVGSNPLLAPSIIYSSAPSIVMELKFTGSLPFWLAQLIRNHNLQRQAFSKYCLSLSKVKSHLSWITS